MSAPGYERPALVIRQHGIDLETYPSRAARQLQRRRNQKLRRVRKWATRLLRKENR